MVENCRKTQPLPKGEQIARQEVPPGARQIPPQPTAGNVLLTQYRRSGVSTGCRPRAAQLIKPIVILFLSEEIANNSM